MTDPEIFPPTLREVLLRPRWLAMLGLSLVVAAVFAWLGQWQLGQALEQSDVEPGDTEIVRPLTDVVEPGDYLPEPLVGQIVETEGTWVPGDFLIVSSRFNGDDEGFWVTGQLRVDDDPATSIAVALGWAPTREDAEAAASALEQQGATPAALTGRLISDEGPTPPTGDDLSEMTRMSPAALLGVWHDIDGLDVYRPYLASQTAPAGLVDIASPAPEIAGLNWLNIFYALEWAVFAGFAFYLWYRLAKDAWEREVEDLEDAAAAASGSEGDQEARG